MKAIQVLVPCKSKHLTHVFAGPIKTEADLIVKSCGTNISANVACGDLSDKIDHLKYF